jgi:hypothetical protein
LLLIFNVGISSLQFMQSPCERTVWTAAPSKQNLGRLFKQVKDWRRSAVRESTPSSPAVLADGIASEIARVRKQTSVST